MKFSAVVGLLGILLCTGFSTQAQVMINEVDYDQDETDTREFVELYNDGDQAVDLSAGAYALHFYNQAGTLYRDFELAGTIGAGGYYVVGVEGVANVDQAVTPTTNLIQNGPNDAVQLVRLGAGAGGSDLVIDGLAYDGENPVVTLDGFTEAADDPFFGSGSIARIPDGKDTGDNATDFVFDSLNNPSPGEANNPPLLPVQTGTEEQLSIYVLDVGQGDSTLVVSPTGRSLLIDGGNNSRGGSVVVPFLRELEIDGVRRTLDYMIASHYDADHIGGLDEVAAEIFPATAYDRGGVNSTNTQSVQDYIAAIAPVRHQLYPGLTIDLGGGAIVEILSVGEELGHAGPTVENKIYPGGEVTINPDAENEFSASIKISFGGFQMIVSGDLTGGGLGSTDVESAVAPAVGDVDVYHVNHAGSLTSSSEAYLSTLQPEVAVISVGENSFGHPVQEVIDRIQTVGAAEVYQTEQGAGGLGDYVANGTILFRTDGSVYSVEGGDLTKRFYRVDDPARILFDHTRSESAGDADWLVDEDSRYPQPTEPTGENDWAGALSSWAYDLWLREHQVETLPSSAQLTFGDSSNPQDLSYYDAIVFPEPHEPLFSNEEVTALQNYLLNGGGLLMIANQAGADRETGTDTVTFWNNFYGQANPAFPFGVSWNNANVTFTGEGAGLGETSSNLDYEHGETILLGEAGVVSGLSFLGGTHMEIFSATNPAVRPLAWRNTISQENTSEAILVRSRFGAGRVVALGDDSPMNDGSGHPENVLLNGYDNPSAPEETHDVLLINAVQYLAGHRAARLPEGAVVINEIQTGGEGFIELFGPSNTSLENCALWGRDASAELDYKLVSLDGLKIPSDGYLVIGPGNLPTTDYVDPLRFPWRSGPARVELRCGMQVIDRVGYGRGGQSVYYEGSGPAVDDPAGEDSIGRDENGTDTDENEDDFAVIPASPGRPNLPKPDYEGTLLITEMASQPTENEFVELVNLSSQPLPIGGLVLSDEDDNNTEGAVRFPWDIIMQPREVIVVLFGGEPDAAFQSALVPGTRLFSQTAGLTVPGFAVITMEDFDEAAGGTSGNIALANGGDNLALYDSSITFAEEVGPADTALCIDGVNYGSPTNTVPIGPGITETANASSPGFGQSLSRISTIDRNNSSVDFQTGALNPGYFDLPPLGNIGLWQIR